MSEEFPNTEINSIIQPTEDVIGIPPEENTESNGPQEISRRHFLKMVGAAAGAVALAAIPRDSSAYVSSHSTSSIVSEITSPEVKLEPTVRTIDFFNLHPVINNHIRSAFPPGFSEQAAFERMGVEDTSTTDGLLDAIPQSTDDTRLLVARYFEKTYGNHGKVVQSVMNKVASVTGGQVQGNRESSSIASAVSFGEVETDTIGNTTTKVYISPEEVNRIINECPEDLINLSFELGSFKIKHSLYNEKVKYPVLGRTFPSTIKIGNTTIYKDPEGNEMTAEEYEEYMSRSREKVTVLRDVESRSINAVDGYAGEETLQNLTALIDIVKQHPDKMLIAAGGNPAFIPGLGLKIPDIREARKFLEDAGLWPENLIMVGVEVIESGYIGPAANGSDIYVSDRDLLEMGFNRASSFATPTITEICKRLIEKGYRTHSMLKKALKNLSENIGESSQYQLLDFAKAKEVLQSKTATN